MTEEANRSRTWKRTHEEYIPHEIERMVTALSLDDSSAEMARSVHTQVIDSDYQQSNYDMLAAACVLAASRLQGLGVSLEEVHEASRVEEQKAIYTTYRNISRALELSIKPDEVEPYVERFVDNLGFPEESRELARRLTRDAVEAKLDTNIAPQSLAATLTYIVTLRDDLDHTQAVISESTGVSPKTIRVHYRDVAEALDVPIRPREGMNVEERRDPPPTAASAMERVVEEFDVSGAVTEEAKRLYNDLEERGEKSPAGLIGGAIWVALNEVEAGESNPMTQAQLANALGVSEATIQQRARDFREGYDD